MTGRLGALRRGGSVVSLGLALAGAARAQTPSAAPASTSNGEEILVVGQANPLIAPTTTGSRLGLTPLETPASASVVDGDLIRARGDLSVIEAVTRAPGITNVGNPGNGDTAVAARGFSGQGSVLQLVDGVRLFPVAGTITFPSDPWNVQRIEVLTGPASVLYGQGALGGAVNVITKQPNTERTEIQAEAGFGSQNTGHVAAGIGGPLNPLLSYRFDASYQRSDGFVDRGRSRSVALSGAIRFAPTETLSLTIRDDYGDLHPSRYFGTPLLDGKLDTHIRHRNYDVSDAIMHWRDNRASLAAEWRPSAAITVSNVGYYLTTKRRWRNLESYCYAGAEQGEDGGYPCLTGYATGTYPGGIVRTDNLGIVHDQRQWGDQGTVKLSTPLGGAITNDLVVGFDANLIKLTYSNDFGSDTQLDEVDPFQFDPGLFFDTQGVAPRYRTRTTEWSLFAEDRLKLGEALSLVGGIRREHDKTSRYTFVYDGDRIVGETPALNGGTSATKRLRNTTWRVGALYQLTRNISLYAQYATGVDPLGTLTTYSTSSTQYFFTNAKGNQVEVGAKASFLDGRGSATFAAYKIVKHDLVAQRTLTSPVEQVGQRSAKGLEAAVTLQLPAHFALDANGTILKARYDDFVSGDTSYTGNVPNNIPQSAANLWLSWSGLTRFEARAGLRYVGHSWSDDANTFRVPGYTVIDAGVSYAIAPQVALDLRVYNLFDKDYAITTYNDQQWLLGRPRSVDVSVRARF